MTTRKLLAALNRNGEPSDRTEFLVPTNNEEYPFKSIKKGKLHKVGYVVLIGKAISEKDLFDRIEYEVDNPKEQKKLIESYFEQIKDFKIGNIISASIENKRNLLIGKQKSLKLQFVSTSWRGNKNN